MRVPRGVRVVDFAVAPPFGQGRCQDGIARAVEPRRRVGVGGQKRGKPGDDDDDYDDDLR